MNLSDFKPDHTQLTAAQLGEWGKILTSLNAVKRLLEITPLVTFGTKPHIKTSPELLALIADQTGVHVYILAETVLMFGDCHLVYGRETVYDKIMRNFKAAEDRAKEIYNQATR